jgi:hypothetical protein
MTDDFMVKFNDFGEKYEDLVNEERSADKSFRKEFEGEHLELLLELFHQKVPTKVESAIKQSVLDPELRETNQPINELDPFASADASAEDLTMSAWANAEPPTEDIDPALWQRFISRKQSHMDLEARVKEAGDTHEQMSRHLVSLQAHDRTIMEEMVELEERAKSVQDNRSRFALNTEVMLKTRQGHVEIDEAPVVTDLKDCEMIERGIVEELNTLIQKSGREKVGTLEEIMVSRSAINLLRWTKKKLSLEHKDAVDLTTELQLLRVTKSLQVLIKMGGHDNQKAAELKRLDRKIEFLNHATREKTLGKKLKLMQVKKKIRQQTRENDRLLGTVQDLEAAVRERVQISNIRDGDGGDTRKQADARMKNLVTRRKLVDLAKLQADEIKFLRDQVESLRKRTFASFAVPHIPANPDELRYDQFDKGGSRPKSRPFSKQGSRGGDYDGRAVTR